MSALYAHPTRRVNSYVHVDLPRAGSEADR